MAAVMCDVCGTASGSRNPRLVQGRYRCRNCLKSHPRPAKPREIAECQYCGKSFTVGRNAAGKFCSNKCVGAYKRAQHVLTSDGLKPYFVRRERESRAPGLSNWQRRALVAAWIKQGRTCAYCDRPATTHDHVMPILRGGTNYVGNLVPACRRCNSEKGARTVTEWKYGKLPASTISATWTRKVVARKPGPPRASREATPIQLALRICGVCGAMHAESGKYCSQECRTEANRIHCRNKYRARVGIPLDAPIYGRTA